MLTMLEFLKSRDINRVAEIYAGTRNYDERADFPTVAQFSGLFSDFIGRLSELEARGDGGYVIIPGGTFDYDGIEASMYKLDDVLGAEYPEEELLAEIEGEYDSIDNVDRLQSLCEKIRGEKLIDSYSYTWSEWEDVIGVPVFDEGLSDVDKDRVAESIIWELSWNGFLAETHEAALIELRELIDEAERQFSDGKTIDGDDFMAEMHEKYGIPEKTEEEKAQERLRTWKRSVKFSIDRQRGLAAAKSSLTTR